MKLRVQICTRRRVTLAAVFASTLLLAFFAAGVSPALAITDPVEDPTYWSQIWDHVGALNPSAAINPEADWQTMVDSWAADGYLADSASAAAAKAAIDASAADVAAMEAAGSIPASEVALATVLTPEFALPAAAAIGAYLLVGTSTGQRLLHIATFGLFGGPGGSPDPGAGWVSTGRVQWSFVSSYTNMAGKTITNIYSGDPEARSLTGGANGYPVTGLDCSMPGVSCSGYTQTRYNVFQATGVMQHQLTEQQAFGSSPCGPVSGSYSGCSVEAYATAGQYKIGVSQVLASGAHTPDFSTATGGAQTDPGTSSAKAGNVRAAIEGNPTLHQEYDCKLAPSSYACPTLPGTTTSTPTPVTTTWVPIYLPQPLPGELYQDYAERLRAGTWLGAISTTDDPMGYPSTSPAAQLAPGTVTQVTTASTTVQLYSPTTGQPVAWPSTPPEIASQTQPVSVEKVPDSYVPAAGGGLDFSPFTSGFSGTCNFPFGVLCIAVGTVSAMNTSPVAPELDWVMPNIDMGPLGTMTMGQHYDVNLGTTSMDTYMGWIRTIISWVLWIGAIWYVGSRLLGLKGGGDPSDAIGEAFGEFTE